MGNQDPKPFPNPEHTKAKVDGFGTRHSFACCYKYSGNLEYLRHVLGHSSILITQRYFQSIQPEDLQSVHVSPCRRGGSR